MKTRIRKMLASAALSTVLAGGVPAPGVLAHDAHRHGAPPKDNAVSAPQAPKGKVPRRLDEGEQRRYFTDTKLLDQDGREVRFYTDALRGKIVLLSFIYTSCTDICPTLMHNLTDVQDQLGDRFGKDVFFVSITVDPEDDTPEELKRYGERYNARPGWTFLTGPKKDVDAVIKRFGEFQDDFEDHSMTFVLGDVKNARWSKMRGDQPPETVLPRIRDLLERRESGDSAAGLTGATMRGKRIYMEGKGRKKITASLPGAGIRAPGAGFPCVNCHLASGAGQSEGGVRSSDITWFTLTKEYGGSRPSGRTHPPYTDETVRKAITGGLDPAGNVLASAHPRFGMDREDLDDLLAYMKVMDSEPVPGVTDNAVRVGTLFPATGPLAEAAREVRALLSGYAAEVNARGGFYNRRLELVEIPYDPSVEGAALAAARAPVESEGVLCFLANIGIPTDGAAAAYLARERVPVFVPLLAAPEGGYGADRYTFHVLAGIRDQARVMVDFLAESLKVPAIRLGILYAKEPSGEKGAEGAREQAKKRGLGIAAELSFVPGAFDALEAVRRMGSDRVDAVLYFGGPSEALAFARGASGEKGNTPFLAPATMVGEALRAAAPGFLQRVFLAAPLAPPDEGTREMADLQRIREKYSVGDRHRSFQLLAYAGAVLLEEGLRRSGKGVTREKLVGAIGNVWKLQTGVTPPLTYNANRRTGAPGAAIVRVDPGTGRLVTVAEWREAR